MIESRRATEDDVALFKEIRLKALKDSPDAYGSTYEASIQRTESSWLEQLATTTSGDLRNTQFAFDGDNCIGIAALYREADAPAGAIIMMWVAPEYRGTAAASTLVQSLLDWAKKAGHDSVSLSVTDTNDRAIQFYKNCGFELTGESVDVDAKRNLRGVCMKIVI